MGSKHAADDNGDGAPGKNGSGPGELDVSGLASLSSSSSLPSTPVVAAPTSGKPSPRIRAGRSRLRPGPPPLPGAAIADPYPNSVVAAAGVE
jgi:hypothetical protein